MLEALAVVLLPKTGINTLVPSRSLVKFVLKIDLALKSADALCFGIIVLN